MVRVVSNVCGFAAHHLRIATHVGTVIAACGLLRPEASHLASDMAEAGASLVLSSLLWLRPVASSFTLLVPLGAQ